MTPYDWANGGSVDVFWMVGMVLLLWRVDVILENGYGISEQNLLYCLKLTSHSIQHYSWSADLLKSFSQLIVSMFTFLSQ